jgi:ribosomal protein S8
MEIEASRKARHKYSTAPNTRLKFNANGVLLEQGFQRDYPVQQVEQVSHM